MFLAGKFVGSWTLLLTGLRLNNAITQSNTLPCYCLLVGRSYAEGRIEVTGETGGHNLTEAAPLPDSPAHQCRSYINAECKYN